MSEPNHEVFCVFTVSFLKSVAETVHKIALVTCSPPAAVGHAR